MQRDRSLLLNLFSSTRHFVVWVCLGVIRGYQYVISPLFPPSCRFTPTCSCYAAEAIRLHGPLKGIVLAVIRILRCHPFSRGGYDPVPPVKNG